MKTYVDKSYCLLFLMLTTLAACTDDNANDEINLIPSEDNTQVSTDPTQAPSENNTETVDEEILNGVLIDSAVMGINYATETQSGVTDVNGTFQYMAGEEITFSIGTLRFPTVIAQDVISPIDMVANSDDPTTTKINIARLLQTLDLDGNPDNGIVIPPEAALSAAPIDFNVTSSEFGTNPAVINLIANSGSINTALISPLEANQHLSETLYGVNVVVNLRNTVWISGGSRTGCDGQRSVYTLTYSETGLATSRVTFETDTDGQCQRVEIVKDEQSFEALANESEFLLTCGDGLCEADELEQRVSMAVDDPRNDCTAVNGEPVADERVITAGGNTKSFNYLRCANTGPNVEAFILQ